MTNNGYINKIVDLQIALYEIRRSKPDYFSKELPKRKEELKPKIKLDVVIDLHLGYCRGEIELAKELGNPFCKKRQFYSLDSKL